MQWTTLNSGLHYKNVRLIRILSIINRLNAMFRCKTTIANHLRRSLIML